MGLTGLFYPWGIILQALAVVHFVRRRPDTYWLWIIIIGGGLGALVYIAAEVLPDVMLFRGVLAGVARRKRVAVLEAVVKENPAVGNLEELADLYLEEGQFARARELYDKVLGSRSDSLDAYYRRGLAELSLDDAKAAVADLDHVVSTDPKYDFNRAIGLLAHACALTGQTARADELFQKAVAITTLSETYYNYATFLADQKRTDEARDYAQRILSRKSTMPRYLQRRERPWFRKAKALLNKLRASLLRESRELEEHSANRRVVEIRAARRHERIDELRHQRGRRNRDAVRRRRFVRDPQILLVQLRPKARHVVPLEHALAVHLEDAARREAAEQRLPDERRIDASFARKRHRFAHAGQRAADRHLIADLAHLARARLGAHVHDPLGIAHALEHRPHLRKRGHIAADHDRERRVDRADLTAADRRVEHDAARRRDALSEPSGRHGRDAAHVDHDRATLETVDDAFVPGDDLLDVRRVRHHRDDDVRLARDVSRRRSGARPGGDEIIHRRPAAIEHDQRMSLREKMFCHGPSHDAKSDEPDLL
jgi:hypothetical protein